MSAEMETAEGHLPQTSPVSHVLSHVLLLTEESAFSFTKSLLGLCCFLQSLFFRPTNFCFVISKFTRVNSQTNVMSLSSLKENPFLPIYTDFCSSDSYLREHCFWPGNVALGKNVFVLSHLHFSLSYLVCCRHSHPFTFPENNTFPK